MTWPQRWPTPARSGGAQPPRRRGDRGRRIRQPGPLAHRRQCPVALRGPTTSTIWTEEGALRTWVRTNLDDYWAAWVARQRKLMGRGTMLLGDWAVAWGVLGIPRLHYRWPPPR